MIAMADTANIHPLEKSGAGPVWKNEANVPTTAFLKSISRTGGFNGFGVTEDAA